MRKSILIAVLVFLTATTMVFAQGAAEPKAKSNSLEIFSWWTAGGEADGLQAMVDVFNKKYPDIEVINATVAGVPDNAKAVLAPGSRVESPRCIPVHAGLKLIDTWVVADLWSRSPSFLKITDDGQVSRRCHLQSFPTRERSTASLLTSTAECMWYSPELFKKYNLAVPNTMGSSSR